MTETLRFQGEANGDEIWASDTKYWADDQIGVAPSLAVAVTLAGKAATSSDYKAARSSTKALKAATVWRPFRSGWVTDKIKFAPVEPLPARYRRFHRTASSRSFKQATLQRDSTHQMGLEAKECGRVLR